MSKVITTRNVYTGEVMNLCQMHFDANANGHDQIQHGLHQGTCDACQKAVDKKASAGSRHMAYDGQEREVGYLTMGEAVAEYGDAQYESDSDTITVYGN